jgi:hypothetical protein
MLLKSQLTSYQREILALSSCPSPISYFAQDLLLFDIIFFFVVFILHWEHQQHVVLLLSQFSYSSGPCPLPHCNQFIGKCSEFIRMRPGEATRQDAVVGRPCRLRLRCRMELCDAIAKAWTTSAHG